MRKFFFVYSVLMIIKKEPFRILLHVLIKHVPSKLHIQNRNHADTCRSTDFSTSGQALDRLQSAPYIAALPPLPYLPRRLQGVLLPKNGISHLEGGFTLRCLQRLSLPGLATLPCSWHYNRYTSGLSIPVLSY